MTYTTLPKWDRNRSIHFWIGMIVSLILFNIAINYETILPDPVGLELEEFTTFDNIQNVFVHTESKEKPAITNIAKLPPKATVLTIVNHVHEVKQHSLLPNISTLQDIDLPLKTDIKSEETRADPPKAEKSAIIFTISERMPSCYHAIIFRVKRKEDLVLLKHF